MENKAGKNLHLEHIEDEILNFGVPGGRAAINFMRSLRDMFSGASRSSVNMTVKWDGAPAIFAGIDPEDNKFFVAKKSVFNVEPKLYKTEAEIDDDLSGTLNSKFKIALAEFSKLGITGVLQGDLMFTDDVEKTTIDGTKYYTFQPNTIVYAVPTDSDLGKVINSAKIGVVWHTTYTGSALQDMKASFGANISKLKKTSTVWMDDATYKDTSGTATFTSAENATVTGHLSNAGKAFHQINSAKLSKFLRLQNSLTGKLVGASQFCSYRKNEHWHIPFHKEYFGCYTDTCEGFYELARLAVEPQDEHNITSWFLSRAIKLLNPKVLVTAAEEDKGGTIYKATNFEYYGLKYDRDWYEPDKPFHTYLKIFDKSIQCEWKKT